MYKNQKIAVIIAAAGFGKRMGSGIPKQFLEIEGKPVLVKTALAFSRNQYVDGFFVVTAKEFAEKTQELLKGIEKFQGVAEGGAERQDSVYNGLKLLPEDIGCVLVHDAARPFVTQEIINAVIEKTVEEGAAVAAVPVKDTIKMVNESGRLSCTLPRNQLKSIQTPQGFQREWIVKAYSQAFSEKFYGTDDAVLVERAGFPICLVDGDYTNIKITTKEDMPMEYRVGTGYDVHRFDKERRLILGGVDIPFELGLAGHSDADVLVHAVMDALLGAAALGDIGKHFPDTDERYRGISSMKLLEQVLQLLEASGYCIGNIDATIIAQEPKLMPFIEDMKINIAETLKISHNKVNIKATTTERLGFTGRKEGIASEAVCILNKI
ncbi:2-C-methyl-D-erythritol 2,4-cyclodiphosphate synthase [Aminipila luticellarii]|uniref:Bifunctional enzyme IspD/IspF n=2 Tax=Aminipila luticellarii TaxID=2507160 RepID=A0A410PXD6_9FIRM|nr:2-C-methyl-D-erythritol 4-phosphate cytidylyltransferase [Aminipila luticellarii]QAT43545.1 2-C-methyl-D-erythritol 2,4-cyclodiphosphate synthase [Aminipila luticellarii]